MADTRYIKTSIWKDEWFASIRGDEQRLFLYLLTNAQTNIIGIYHISLREMAFDTGLDDGEIKKIFKDRLEPDGKAFYEVGYVVMKNWLKNQKLNGNMLVNAQECFNSSPEWLRKKLLDKNDKLYIPFESLLKRSKAFGKLRESELELEIEVEVEKKGNPKGNGESPKSDIAGSGDRIGG